MLTVRAAFAAVLALGLAGPVRADPPGGRIVVSANHRFFQYEDGTPFFWLGDTAWLLFQQLDRRETLKYLDDRRRKGFNVIQCMLLHAADMKSAYGAPALLAGDPGRPNATAGNDPAHPGEYDYWDHVDWVVDQAGRRGLQVALVPAWGSLVRSGALNEGNAEAYATFLAERYRRHLNVIWVLGGDIQGDIHPEVWRALGRTLKRLDPGHLVTFHPYGRTESSTWFHEEPWLDFNMFQSGHRRYDQDTGAGHRYGEDSWRYVADGYAQHPPKPVLDGEPSYENIPQGLHDTSQPYWTAGDCRRYAYWSVFAGAAGHTYGDNAVMQLFKPGQGAGAYGPRAYWDAALDDPGAGQLRFLARLLLSRSFFDRVPDQSLVADNDERYQRVLATRGAGYVLAYTYTGRPFRLRLGVLPGRQLRARWYSPRDGSERASAPFANRGTRTFVPPGRPRPGNDWVLVVESTTMLEAGRSRRNTLKQQLGHS